MQYRDFQDEKLSLYALGCMRLPVIDGDDNAIDEPAAAARLEAIRDRLRRGLSPEQMAARNGGPVDLSPSTIYRWVSAGYDGMANAGCAGTRERSPTWRSASPTARQSERSCAA